MTIEEIENMTDKELDALSTSELSKITFMKVWESTNPGPTLIFISKVMSEITGLKIEDTEDLADYLIKAMGKKKFSQLSAGYALSSVVDLQMHGDSDADQFMKDLSEETGLNF